MQGQDLKAIRKSLHMTQQEFAVYLGIKGIGGNILIYKYEREILPIPAKYELRFLKEKENEKQ